MSEKRYVILIRPDTQCEPVIVEEVSPDFQFLVGGELYTVKADLINLSDVCMVTDKEARFNGRPFNPFATFLRGFSDEPIFGTVAIAKCTINTHGLRAFNEESFRIVCEFIERLRSYYLNLDRLVLNKVIKS